jgi:hypothetical protein
MYWDVITKEHTNQNRSGVTVTPLCGSLRTVPVHYSSPVQVCCKLLRILTTANWAVSVVAINERKKKVTQTKPPALAPGNLKCIKFEFEFESEGFSISDSPDSRLAEKPELRCHMWTVWNESGPGNT